MIIMEAKASIKKLVRMKDYGSDRSSYVRLDKNERTVAFSTEIFREMMAGLSADQIVAYPDQTSLYKKLSAFYELPEDHFLLSPGSDAGIKMIFETYFEKSDRVIYLDPTYAMVDVYANMFQVEKITCGFDSALNLDFKGLMSSITDGVKGVIVANPNQPTGTILTESQIIQLLDRTAQTDTLVILDEAYQPFSGFDSAMKYVMKYSHLIVLQTFSKAFGLAGVRLGFIVSSPKNINYLYRVKTHSDINVLAIQCGKYLLDHYEIVESYINDVNQSKTLLTAELKKMGVVSFKSFTNFMHIKLPGSINYKRLATKMKDEGYLVRVGGDGLPAVLDGCMRITIGPPAQMIEFLNVLRKCCMKAIF